MRTGRIIAVLLLVLSLGLHWALLQSVAWVSMVVRYSQNDSLKVALVKTFDGQHPCSLCKVIEQARGEERRSSDTLSTVPVHYDWIYDRPEDVYTFGSRFSPSIDVVQMHLLGLTEPPPTPPPRFIRGV